MNYHADTTNYNYAPLFRHRISLKADKIAIQVTCVCLLAALGQRGAEITEICVPALYLNVRVLHGCYVFEILGGQMLSSQVTCILVCCVCVCLIFKQDVDYHY